jgi:hypothetical protein
MTNPLRETPFFQELDAEHRRWLSGFDARYLSHWTRILNQDEEAAWAEAGIRRLLEGYHVSLEPNDSLTGQEERPDFLCNLNGSDFEVEVTHISVQKATEVTGLVEGGGACNYNSLNPAISRACTFKATKCANRNHPTLLAVVTFHTRVSALSFSHPHIESLLTGEASITWDMNRETCQCVGESYETTGLRFAAFLCPDKTEKIGYARCSISGLLLCGLGRERSPEIRGVLHPNPARPFNPAILPQIEFGQVVVDRTSGQLRVDWPEERDEYAA